MFIRPYPLDGYQDSFAGQVGNTINGNRLQAGKGIRLVKHGNNTTIESSNTRVQDAMVYRGNYSFNEQYFPNDVVYVDPSVIYTNQSGSVITDIGSGSYICLNHVGNSWQTSDYLINSIYPSFTSYGGTVTDDMADQYRHYDCNKYYPPNTPITGLTRKSEVTWTTQVSQSFWAPLGGIGGSSTATKPQYYCITQLYDNGPVLPRCYVGAVPMIITYPFTGSNASIVQITFSTGSAGDVVCPIKLIGKPNRMRYIASEKIEGTTINYTAYNDNTRVCMDNKTPQNTELQVVFPRYQTAYDCGFTTGSLGVPTGSITGTAAYNLLASQCVLMAEETNNTGLHTLTIQPGLVYQSYHDITGNYYSGSTYVNSGSWRVDQPITLAETQPARHWARRFLQA